MGLTIGTVRAAANTSTGNQDFTTADMGGLTPIAALFIVTRAVTDGTAQDHSNLSVGAATATDERWAIAGNAEHGVGTSDTHRQTRTDRCIHWMNDGDHNQNGIADFVSFISDGVRVNWSDAPSNAILVTVVLFAGTDLSAFAGNFTAAALDAATDVTDPGFEPEALIVAYCNLGVGQSTWMDRSVGVVSNDGTTVIQRSIGQANQNNAATSAIGLNFREDYGGGYVNNIGTQKIGLDFGSFDANGFSCTSRIESGAGDEVAYLALDLGSSFSAKVGTHTTPTSTGNDSETDPGFTPQFVLLGMSHAEAAATAYGNANAGPVGLAAITSGAQFANSVCSEDAAATMNEQSLSDNVAVEIPDDDGAAGVTATFVSFDTNGWTNNYTAVEAAGKKFWYLAIEEEAAAGQPMMKRMQGIPTMPGARDRIGRWN